jgi:3-oxoacyl-[acyl-carrier protein] reductase
MGEIGMRLDGKAAIVTGSATGIGAAVARQLAARGCAVVINYTKSLREAEETRAEIDAAGGRTIMVQADVSKDDDCRRMAKACLDAFGRIDILVNNAGTTKIVNHADLDGLTEDDWLGIYKTNVLGAFQMIRACTPSLKANGFGAVVNVSSIAGVTGIGSSIAYAASKGAMNTMTISLARALAPEIRVNAVCPGFVGTRWFKDALGQDVHDRMVKQQQETMPLRRAGMPEDVADSVVFFCTEGARHITGETLMTDAGLHLSLTPLARR